MRFKTKVDIWIVLLLTLIPAGALFAIVATGDLWVVPLVLAIWGLVALIIVPCDYTLAEANLVVRSGLVKWRVPYAEIERVYPTRNPLSSPAWSLDRLAIVYGKKLVMVSPAQRNEFLAQLMARAHLRQQGQELVRA